MIKINKNRGHWVEDGTDTLLDNIAYELFCRHCDVNPSTLCEYINQYFFRFHRKGWPYYPYYDKAKDILRIEKLNKLKCMTVINVEKDTV